MTLLHVFLENGAKFLSPIEPFQNYAAIIFQECATAVSFFLLLSERESVFSVRGDPDISAQYALQMSRNLWRESREGQFGTEKVNSG